MRFPVDVAVLQKFGDTECPVVFFETPASDLVAVCGVHRFVECDFESIMPLVLRRGPCEFRIPAEMTLLREGARRTTGLLKLSISIEGDPLIERNTYTIAAIIEVQNTPVYSGRPVQDLDLLMGIEKSLAEILRSGAVVPHRCLFCKFSDFEESTTLGNLRCYVGDKASYCHAAAEVSKDAKARYIIFGLGSNTVEDFGTCAAFEVRPVPWGYRG
jgi:hypothetical protein